MVTTRRAAAKAASEASAPVLLTPFKKRLLKSTQTFLVMLLVLSTLGLIVLADTEQKYPLTRSEFGQKWKYITQWNPMLQPFLFNLALLGLVMIFKTLRDDNIAAEKASASKKAS